MTLAEIDALIDLAVQNPRSAMVDGRSVTAHSLKDLLDARERLIADAIVEDEMPAGFGLRFTTLVPPGCG